MIKIDIKSWLTGEVKFTAEIDCNEDAKTSIKFGLALKWAVKNKADLQGAYLQGAYLQGVDLQGADLRGAYLQGAYLRGADLRGAYLQRAYLRGADLRGADLRGAYLRGADLRGADNSKILLIGRRPIIQIGMIGSRSDYLIAYNTEEGVLIQAGCWTGTLNELHARVEKEHGNNDYAQEYAAAIKYIKAIIAICKE